jgi:hypothetical protein
MLLLKAGINLEIGLKKPPQKPNVEKQNIPPA